MDYSPWGRKELDLVQQPSLSLFFRMSLVRLSAIAANPRKGVHKLCNLFQMFIHPNKYQGFYHIKRENEKAFCGD